MHQGKEKKGERKWRHGDSQGMLNPLGCVPSRFRMRVPLGAAAPPLSGIPWMHAHCSAQRPFSASVGHSHFCSLKWLKPQCVPRRMPRSPGLNPVPLSFTGLSHIHLCLNPPC